MNRHFRTTIQLPQCAFKGPSRFSFGEPLNMDLLPQIGRAILQSVLTNLTVAIAFVLPLFIVGWRLQRCRKKYRAEATEPFTELPLRPPGESLRKKLEELNDRFETELTASAIITSRPLKNPHFPSPT